MKASRFDNPFLAWAMTMEDYKDSVANDGLPARAPHPPATPHVDIAEIHDVHIRAMHVVAESKQVLGQVLLAPPEQAAAAHRASCISRLRLMWWYAGQTTHVHCQLVAFHTLPCVPSQHPTKGTPQPRVAICCTCGVVHSCSPQDLIQTRNAAALPCCNPDLLMSPAGHPVLSLPPPPCSDS